MTIERERARELDELARSEIVEAEARFIARVIMTGDADSADVCAAWYHAMIGLIHAFQTTLAISTSSTPISISQIIDQLLDRPREDRPVLAQRIDELIRIEREMNLG